ncbi:hypothetical protein RQP50_27685 [Paenibacillus sp. chi10]|uniref:Uncharacterized protein n=1 Tax=Paenibacillus suaedae TaxID=3077233 RepID=A0AAJ2K4M3_9BACL|nr:hypothetical protein [Paenibacillus sp. chi10]MDT8980017.1 hypothetical protein [Paenibacillus sp. chi10]
MNEEDIKQFTAALAVRYLQVTEEYSLSARYFINMDVTTTPIEKFQSARVQAETAYAKWLLFNEVISELPLDIKQAFLKECELLKSE